MKTIILTLSLVLFTACGGGGGTTTSTTAATSDTTAPVITMIGGGGAAVAQFEPYTDAGATAIDAVDGNVSVSTTGIVDVNLTGLFILTYTATDAAGNMATATRKVLVYGFPITHNGIPYGVVTSPYTGKVWLDRNLGAAQVCTSLNDIACFGDYYQWGRNADGHENSLSGPIGTQATDVNNTGSTSFIKGFLDWASVDANGSIRSANWSKTDGTSVCPIGFRVPTTAELQAETINNGVTDNATAFANFLKLPSAGYRGYYSGTLILQGSWGYVWASSVSGSYSRNVYFGSGYASVRGNGRASGFSVRCLRN